MVELDFVEIVRSMSHCVFPFSPVSLTESCSFWCSLKHLFTLHKLADKAVTDDVTFGRRDVDPHGRFCAFKGRKRQNMY